MTGHAGAGGEEEKLRSGFRDRGSGEERRRERGETDRQRGG